MKKYIKVNALRGELRITYINNKKGNAKMKHDYAQQNNKPVATTDRPKMWEVFTMMLIGCFGGLLFLAWLGLL